MLPVVVDISNTVSKEIFTWVTLGVKFHPFKIVSIKLNTTFASGVSNAGSILSILVL